ncbi:MAG: hypothetical protein ABI333_28475 [bacterium]
MKRLLFGFAVFWGLVAAAVVTLLILQDQGESKDTAGPPPGPMTCQGLQQRAEQCADPLADLAAELAEKRAKRQGESGFGASAVGTVLRSFVHNVIGEKKVVRYCKQYWDTQSPSLVRAKKELEQCYGLAGCTPFVKCLRKIGNRLINEL